ncbi:MAG: hypothetical protein WBJ84_00600 [Bacteroidales bacterium]
MKSQNQGINRIKDRALYCKGVLINVNMVKLRSLLKRYSPVYEPAFYTILIFLFSFPEFTPYAGTGLDNSYIWALNHLFHNDTEMLRQLVYPLGVLGFLKFPVAEGYNFLIALIFYSVLKLWFIAAFLYYSSKSLKYKILSALAAFVVCLFLPLELLITGIIVIHAFAMIESRNLMHIIPVSLIAVTGSFIKATIGVLAFPMLAMALILDFFRYRNHKRLIQQVLISSVLVLISASFIMGGISPGFRFILQSVRLTFGYSGALALFPDNNWWLISGFLLTLFITPFLNSGKKSGTMLMLLVLPAFAMWKYGITRQDIYHYSMMIYFFIFFWVFLIAFSENHKWRVFAIACISIALLLSNMKNVNIPAYQPLQVDLKCLRHFDQTVLKYKEFISQNAEKSNDELEKSRLDKDVLKVIGESEIDVYPWELSYIPANALNWKPRKTLQGGSFARWLDSLGAADFSRSEAPEFLLLHFVKDRWNGGFGSIDGRYLLNDNPLTIMNIFNHYSLSLKTNDFMLFRKNPTNNLKEAMTGELLESGWDKWIQVPEPNSDIVRVKVRIRHTIRGKIMDFIYKSAPCFIDYSFEDGKVLTYRFIPENAEDGIWIHPFVQFPESNRIEPSVTAIRLRNRRSAYYKEQFQYQFEAIGVKPDEKNDISNPWRLFGKTDPGSDSLIISLHHSFDNKNIDEIYDQLPDFISHAGSNNAITEGGGFSFTWICNTSSLFAALDSCYTYVSIESDLAYFNSLTKASLVISLEDSGDDFWQAQELNTGNTEGIMYAHIQTRISRYRHNPGLLKIYVWNHDNIPLTLKEQDIRIIASVD